MALAHYLGFDPGGQLAGTGVAFLTIGEEAPRCVLGHDQGNWPVKVQARHRGPSRVLGVDFIGRCWSQTGARS